MSTETKQEKFLRLAEKRTNIVLDKIRILANCSNTYAYDYQDQDVDEIFDAIEEALKAARDQFRTSDRGDKYEFKLSSRRAEQVEDRDANAGGSLSQVGNDGRYMEGGGQS